MKPIVQAIRFFRKQSVDPVKHCLVYKAVGCAHVDGMLCNMRTCDVKVKVEITPVKASESERTGRSALLMPAVRKRHHRMNHEA